MNFMTPEEYAAMADATTSDIEAMEERAAILEYQGGFSRAEAWYHAAQQPSFVHRMNLYSLRMQAMRLAARKKGARK